MTGNNSPDKRSIPQSDRPDPVASDTAMRGAVTHALVTIGFSFGVLIVGAFSSETLRNVLLLIAPAIMLIGGLAALVRTYLAYRRGGRWGIWQGASWFLLTLAVVMFFSTGTLVLNPPD